MHTDFNVHFPGQPVLARCSRDSLSLVILTPNIVTGQAKALHTHSVLWAITHPLTLMAIPKGIEAEVFTGWMPFLSPNQQCQSTEG